MNCMVQLIAVLCVCNTYLHFRSHFLGEPGLAGCFGIEPFWHKQPWLFVHDHMSIPSQTTVSKHLGKQKN